MKIQNLALIFLAIIIPIVLLLTYYNQIQVKNLSLQLQYNTKLSDATHDAIKAFQLNTVNNAYSQVSDSLKRDVQASVNVFLSSMAKSMGISGERTNAISEYVPAIVFTLYDGYYIYAPSHAEKLKEETKLEKAIDGSQVDVTIAVSQNPPVETYEPILKPYVYYAVRYSKDASNDFIVNYSLDNYITVYGMVGGKYVTKAGYLGVPGDIKIEIDNDKLFAIIARDILSYALSDNAVAGKEYIDILNDFKNPDNQQKIKEMEEMEEVKISALKSSWGKDLIDKAISQGQNAQNAFKSLSVKEWLSYLPVTKIDSELVKNDTDALAKVGEILNCIKVKTYKDSDFSDVTDIDVKSYCTKSLQFTNWVNEKLGSIEASDAMDEKGIKVVNATDPNDNIQNPNDSQYFEFKNDNSKIFSTTSGNDPEDPTLSSPFIQHKMKAIKTSIKANLISAIARYNQYYFEKTKMYSIKMPELTDTEWETITNNVSMTTFMQGMIIGSKVYNDYSVVKSEENKEVIDKIYYFNPSDIYYVDPNDKAKGGTIYYHELDCKGANFHKIADIKNLVGFKSIEFEVYTSTDKEGNTIKTYGTEIEALKKLESIKNVNFSAAYDCIINRNYTSGRYDKDNEITLMMEKAKLIAITREKNRQYKVNGYFDAEY